MHLRTHTYIYDELVELEILSVMHYMYTNLMGTLEQVPLSQKVLIAGP